MSDMALKKAFIVVDFNINQTFHWVFNLRGYSLYVLSNNELKIDIFTYSASADSITQPDPSLIQLSILYKISWKDLSSMYLELVTVLTEDLQ